MKWVSLTVLGLAVALSAAPALAKDKDDKNSRGRGDQHETRGDDDRGGDRHFGDRDHQAIHDYYVDSGRGGHCPPGLAKKNNGCMPPGQARKWAVGRPLPHDVTYYALPPALVVQLTPPPGGYRYVRVASDVLMIAVGTGVVIDAIQDLGGR
jgi:Ni/Co efflux regulator RcnB